MTKDEYDHVRSGYTSAEPSKLLQQGGIKNYKTSTFSIFFTELVEYMINFGHVKILTRRKNTEKWEGVITPQNRERLSSVGKVYWFYALIYRVVTLLPQLDRLLFLTGGCITIAAGRKAGHT